MCPTSNQLFSDNSIFFLILDNINHFANSAAHIHEVHFYFRCPNAPSENLTFPDGTGFYPDEQDGQKGYNTSPNRGADTFFPFNNLSNLVNVYSHSGANYVYTAEKSGYAIYTAFNGSEPTIENISGKAKKIKYDNKSTSHGTEQLYIAYLLAGDKITAKAATGWSLLSI